jgi:hypothetical protein
MIVSRPSVTDRFRIRASRQGNGNARVCAELFSERDCMISKVHRSEIAHLH